MVFWRLVPVSAHAQDFGGLISQMRQQANYWTPERQRAACMGAYHAAMARAAQSESQIAATRQAAIAHQVDQFRSSAQFAMNTGNYIGAIYDFEQALSLNPNDPALKRGLALAQNQEGCSLFTAKDFDGAADYFQQALQHSPDDAVIQQNLANSREQLRQIALRLAERQADQTAAMRMQKMIPQGSEHFWFVPADDNGWSMSPDADPLVWDSNVVDLRGVSGDVVDISVAQGIHSTISPQDGPPVSAASEKDEGPQQFVPPANRQEGQAMLDNLNRQIHATQMQLASLGFATRAADFEQFHDLATEQQNELRQRLTKQLEELTIDVIADKAQGKMLDFVQGASEEKVEGLLKSMQQMGISTDVLQQSLTNAMSQTDQRVKLAAEAEVVVQEIQAIDTFKDAREHYDKGTVEGQQEALLTGLSVIEAAKPAVEIAKAAYAVGDAGRCLMILSAGEHQIDVQTTQQLADLNIITNRMKTLVSRRAAVQNALRTLP